ncbi:hypothetical protein BDE02_16G072500 [Populus trichocarpa]|nr:hypothetical protein BDE02_16G072500 [Populus trichocarpa]
MATLKTKQCLNLVTRFINSRTPPFHYKNTRTLQTLAFKEIQSSPNKPDAPTTFILHGLLGSGRNWRSFSRNLASSFSEWRMVLVDMRNHGKSVDIEGLDPPHNMFNAAMDVANLVKEKGWEWPDVVIGHSMGGKVALQFAESCTRGDYGHSVSFPEHLWVLDSVPVEVSPEYSDGEVEKVLRTLQVYPHQSHHEVNQFISIMKADTGVYYALGSVSPWLPVFSRWLVNHMIQLGFSKSLSEWIGSNLKKSGEQESWAFDLKGMEIGLVVAEKSDRWDPDLIQRLESLSCRTGDESEGKFSLHVLPNSGHWVHVDNPKRLLEIVTPRMASLST